MNNITSCGFVYEKLHVRFLEVFSFYVSMNKRYWQRMLFACLLFTSQEASVLAEVFAHAVV